MSTAQSPSQAAGAAKPFLFDLDGIDLDATAHTRDAIAEWIPHRHEMALLDSIVWHDDQFSNGIARWDVRDDEFWVKGHFPQAAMLPGVLQVEAGAQLACYLYNRRYDRVNPAAFLRIEDAVFRKVVEPNQTLYVLCKEQKNSPRRFICDIQGIVNSQICFTARIHGMNFEGRIG